MSDSTDPATPSPSPSPTPEPQHTGPEMSAGEVASGKMFAILCYAINFVGFPFWIIPLITRDNAFALYHAKQCLVLWIILFALCLIGAVLTSVCIGVVFFPIAGVISIVFNVMGVLNANNGMCKPLPVIGAWGESWFKGIQKK